MTLDIVIYKNEKIGAFTTPQFIDIEPEKAAVQLVRSLKVQPEKAGQFADLTFWKFGKFDDETGKIDLLPVPELLVDLRVVVAEVIKNGLEKTEGNA